MLLVCVCVCNVWTQRSSKHCLHCATKAKRTVTALSRPASHFMASEKKDLFLLCSAASSKIRMPFADHSLSNDIVGTEN